MDEGSSICIGSFPEMFTVVCVAYSAPALWSKPRDDPGVVPAGQGSY
jgi:hypothetical protein